MKKAKKIVPKRENITLPFFSKKENGKIQNESTVVYSFSLPCLAVEEFEDCKDFLLETKKAFLSFLEKESKKKREGTFLGTLSFQAEENRVTLLSSFSPFEEKNERKVATFTFSEKGKLIKIER